jgi:hypothetical protein
MYDLGAMPKSLSIAVKPYRPGVVLYSISFVFCTFLALVAQLVERCPEEAGVGGSNPSQGTSVSIHRKVQTAGGSH